MRTTLDTIGADAVEQARQAALAEAGQSTVGEHLDTVAEENRVVTHLFACTDPAYRGWRWSVTVARPPRARTVTIDEVALVAGPDSILAPEWVPFGERLRADDLGVGDVIPADPSDPRLVPAYTDAIAETDAEAVSDLWWEFGLGRERVLSVVGRDDAAERWLVGDRGPGSAMARHAQQPCGTCGFLVPLGGPLGQVFGACTNELSPADGGVVAVTFGCGAHSQSIGTNPVEQVEMYLDETGFDLLDMQPGEHDEAQEQDPLDAQPRVEDEVKS